jgi:hypothetical protein
MNFYQTFAALSFFVLFTTGYASRDLANDAQCLADIGQAMAGGVSALQDAGGGDLTAYKENLEEACKEVDGNVVEVSVTFSNDACSADLSEGVLPQFFCVPDSCGSNVNDLFSNFATVSLEGLPGADDCKDFEVTVVGEEEEDTTSAGAQSQYLSSLGFFLIQGVIVSSFMVVML